MEKKNVVLLCKKCGQEFTQSANSFEHTGTWPLNCVLCNSIIISDMLNALQYVVKYHRDHDSGEGELFGLDYVTTCISAIAKAKG